MDQERAADIKRKLTAIHPRRDGAEQWAPATPYDAFPFIGDGPFYEFTLPERYGLSVASALNYFRQIGAAVLQSERRTYVDWDCGQHLYQYFLVEWHPPTEVPA